MTPGHMGWTEAADLILERLNGVIGSKRVYPDFARQMMVLTVTEMLAVR